jgi:hypothetical protein
MYKDTITEANKALHRKFNTANVKRLTPAKQRSLAQLDKYHQRMLTGK